MVGEKGEYGIVYVNKILDSCDYHYRMCLQSSLSSDNKNDAIDTLRKLKDALSSSLKGFDNLIITYKDQNEVSKDYDECKNRVNNMILGIIHDIKQLTTICDISVAHSDPDDYNSNVINYNPTGLGYLSDDYDISDSHKKHMVTTSLSPIVDDGNNKYNFFKTNNLVLLRTKKENVIN